MTIHKSKGLEFPCVFLIGMSDGILPHSSAMEANNMEDLINGKNGKEKVEEAMEEERRLAYVGITRAKETLYISSPSYYRGKHVAISCFLKDVYDKKEQTLDREPKKDIEKKVAKKVAPRKINTFEQPPKVLTGVESSVVHEDVLRWLCSNDTCNAQERIQDYTLTSKRCSFCGFSMSSKMIRITRQL
jgi:DNA helicase II / ATP-dependent DNA helicase PcrA